MMNCIMLVKDRPKLTHQALTSFAKHTDVDWTLTIIDDASQPETAMMCRLFAKGYQSSGKVALLRNETSSGITAQVRNLGVYWSERRFGRGDWLCLLDNDCYFMEKWASRLCYALDTEKAGYYLLGGVNHPYHKETGGAKWKSSAHGEVEVRKYLAVAGTCWLMPWPVWDMFGPLVETGAPGPGNSEDAAFCDRIRAVGAKVGAIWPHMVHDCGITQTGGKLSPGAEVKPRVENVYYE